MARVPTAFLCRGDGVIGWQGHPLDSALETTLEIGAVIAHIGEGKGAPDANVAKGGASPPAEEPAPQEKALAPVEATPEEEKSDALSPTVRKLVEEHGLDPTAIAGTGKGGRLTKQDYCGSVPLLGRQLKEPTANHESNRIRNLKSQPRVLASSLPPIRACPFPIQPVVVPVMPQYS